MVKHQITTDLVKSLISKQFPIWQDLLIEPVVVQGWDNRTFRLGNHLLVRMPSAVEYAPKIIKKQKWLPKLSSLLPFAIPKPIAMGNPDENFPYPWSVYNWLEGNSAASLHVFDADNIASSLAQFVTALNNIDTSDGSSNELIAEPGDFAYIDGLKFYDAEMRQAIDLLKDQIDANVATKIWDQALATTWQSTPVLVHGDISAGNILIKEEQLSSVIDFGGLSIGDPACDLVIAWKFFRGKGRKIFRESLSFNNDTWHRARGWALWKSMIIAANLTESNQVETLSAWPTIQEIIQEYKLI